MTRFDPTPQTTVEFWRRMQQHFGTKVVQKPDSPLMKASGRGLQRLGIMSSDTFMTQYTTVLHNTIYPWFIVGQGDTEALWRQIEVCIHEHQHVVQFRRMSMPLYALAYGGSTRKRALLEAEAYCCNLEMRHWRTGELISTQTLADLLLSYGCKRSDVQAAKEVYDACHLRLKAGEYRADATLLGIEILSEISES